MTGDPTMQEIIKKGPKQFMTTRERFDYIALRVVIVAVFVLGAGYVANHEATNNVADCTNTNLGARSDSSDLQLSAQIDESQGLTKALQDLGSASSQAAAASAFVELQSTESKYQAALLTVRQARAAHPLGQC